jgi:ribosomal protein L16 Arg81 hydroxylase
MDKITLENILEPVGVANFFKNYWGKKHLIIRRNKFKDLFTWNDFNNYLNRYPHVKGLQIIDYRKEGDGRWCLDKVRNNKLQEILLSKKEMYKQWTEQDRTFVIPFVEYEKKTLVDICFEFEKYFGYGQANVYASPKANSKSFPAHADGTENFLFHTEGKTKWTVYKEFAPAKPNEIAEEFILEPGDLLYIPQYQYHKVDTIGPRILISIHFKNKPNQTLEKFKVTTNKQNKRPVWINWQPEKKQKPKSQSRLMNKANWSKPYFNKL